MRTLPRLLSLLSSATLLLGLSACQIVIEGETVGETVGETNNNGTDPSPGVCDPNSEMDPDCWDGVCDPKNADADPDCWQPPGDSGGPCNPGDPNCGCPDWDPKCNGGGDGWCNVNVPGDVDCGDGVCNPMNVEDPDCQKCNDPKAPGCSDG